MNKDNFTVLQWIGIIGTAMAVTISWAKWHSFWWMALHGLLGWFYVIWYFAKGY